MTLLSAMYCSRAEEDNIHEHNRGCAALQQDILRKLAVQEGPLMVGTRYWGKQALTSVLSSLLAKRMHQLLQHPETAHDRPELGALLVVSGPHHVPCCMPRYVGYHMLPGIKVAVRSWEQTTASQESAMAHDIRNNRTSVKCSDIAW